VIEKKEEYKGNLVLGIHCMDCNAQFEINADAVAFAMITKAGVWEYVEFVQNSTCPLCKKKR
jgi:hypothetical protein